MLADKFVGTTTVLNSMFRLYTLRCLFGTGLLLCLTGCPKAPQQSQRPQGKEAIPNAILWKLRKTYQRKGLAAEIRLWRQLVKANSTQSWIGEGHIRIGLYEYHRKRWERSIVSFRSALKYPLSTKQQQRMIPSFCKALYFHRQFVELQRRIPSYLHLMKPYDRRWSLHILALSANELQLPDRAFVWNTRLLPLLPEPSQTQLRAKLKNQFLNFSSQLLQQLLKEHQGSPTIYPYRQMALRLAHLQLRQGKRQQARQTLTQWRMQTTNTTLYARWKRLYRKSAPPPIVRKPRKPPPSVRST